MQSRVRIRRPKVDNIPNKPIRIQQTCRQFRSFSYHYPCTTRHERNQDIYHFISKLCNLYQMQGPAIRAPSDLGIQCWDPLRQRTIRRVPIRRHLQRSRIPGACSALLFTTLTLSRTHILEYTPAGISVSTSPCSA